MSSIFFHLDFDAFFASVEQLDAPALVGRPVIVGADPDGRGVVSACSYAARKSGIHSAMPISIAKQKCPDGVFLPVRMQRYQEISQAVMTMLQQTAPATHQMSIDEAFLDYSGTDRLLGNCEKIAGNLRQKILTEYGLTVSIGIGSNPYIAKLASAACKPDGLLRIQDKDVLAFIDSTPLHKLWGIGPKTCEQLTQFNFCRAADIRAAGITDLVAILGRAAGERIWKIAHGIDPGVIHEQPKSRSISTEHTFMRDIGNTSALYSKLFEMCNAVMLRVLHEGFRSQTVVVRLRSNQFETHSAQKTLPGDISSTEELFQTARQLIAPLAASARRIRLIGVGLGKLSSSSGARQNNLFTEKRDKQKSVEAAVLALQKKFGSAAITKAELIQKDSQHDT